MANNKSEELGYRLLRVLIKSLAVLPLGVLYLIGDVLRFILHRVIGYRTEVVRKNLHSVFPEKSDSEIRKIENDFYRQFVNVFVEAVKLAHISDDEVRRRVKVDGYELVNEALDNGRSVILMLGHYGNWEWVTSVAMYFRPEAVSCEIYHPLGNKAFDRLMLDLRSRFGTVNIPMDNTVRTLLGMHRDGQKFVCGFIADQRPLTYTLKHWTDFCGIDTAYVNGGEAIGTKINAEFIYVEMLPEKRGQYKMTLSKIEPLRDGEENPYTHAFLKRLEDSIRRNPPYWLWSHNRWKRKRPTPES